MYGNLGYSKVLEAIFLLTKRRSFFDSAANNIDSDTLADIIDNCADIIFFEHKCCKAFHNSFWKARIYQIKCAANLVKYTSSRKNDFAELLRDKLKNHFAELLRDSLKDTDIRVRLEACSNLPLLLQMYSKHDAIYKSLLYFQLNIVDGDTLNYELIHQDREFGIWNLITLCVSCALMGLESVSVRRQAVMDILKLCCSRFKILDEFDALPHIVLKNFLVNIISWLSSKFGYESMRLFFVDNINWLLNEWIDKTVSKSDDPKLRKFSIKLDDFPYFLFSFNDYEEFVRSTSAALIPIVCQMPREVTFLTIFFFF
jgi:hypothetical protein